MTARHGRLIEVKFVEDDDGARVEGYGAIFNEVDHGGDVIAPGAFAKTLHGGRRIKMLWQHDPSDVIGVWDEVSEDARGLRVRGRLLDTTKGRDVRTLAQAGAIEGLSIGYRAINADRSNGRRVLREIDLWEVSLVTFPMQPAATMDVKSALEDGDLTPFKRMIEGAARDAGLSAREAMAAAAGAAKELKGARDADRQLNDLAAHIAAARNPH